MLSPKLKGLIEGFMVGSTATTILYTVALQAGWIVSAQGAELIVEDKLKPIKDAVETNLLLSLETRIRDLTREKCNAGPSLDTVLQTEIDRLQKQHLDIGKVYYNVAVRCPSSS